jgi:hypothetical protein
VTTALIIAALAIGISVFLFLKRRYSPFSPDVQRVAAWFAYPDRFDLAREPLNPFFVHTADGESTAAQKRGLVCIAIYVEFWLHNAGLFGVEGHFIREKLATIGGQEASYTMLMETIVKSGRARYESGRFFAVT